jgi:phosphoenolpyruvate-protein kinase (PTS system EI component)
VSDHFGAFVPTGRAVNPITKTNWEGTGVSPDIAVPKEAALKTAHLMALKKSYEKQTDEESKAAYKKLIDQTTAELEQLKKEASAVK